MWNNSNFKKLKLKKKWVHKEICKDSDYITGLNTVFKQDKMA